MQLARPRGKRGGYYDIFFALSTVTSGLSANADEVWCVNQLLNIWECHGACWDTSSNCHLDFYKVCPLCLVGHVWTMLSVKDLLRAFWQEGRNSRRQVYLRPWQLLEGDEDNLFRSTKNAKELASGRWKNAPFLQARWKAAARGSAADVNGFFVGALNIFYDPP